MTEDKMKFLLGLIFLMCLKNVPRSTNNFTQKAHFLTQALSGLQRIVRHIHPPSPASPIANPRTSIQICRDAQPPTTVPSSKDQAPPPPLRKSPHPYPLFKSNIDRGLFYSLSANIWYNTWR